MCVIVLSFFIQQTSQVLLSYSSEEIEETCSFLLLTLGELQNSLSLLLCVPLQGEHEGTGDVSLVSVEGWLFTNGFFPVAYGKTQCDS